MYVIKNKEKATEYGVQVVDGVLMVDITTAIKKVTEVRENKNVNTDNLYDCLEELGIIENTKSGRTTRLIDKYIQQIYSGPDLFVNIIDHTNNFKDNMVLYDKVVQRLTKEHKEDSNNKDMFIVKKQDGYYSISLCPHYDKESKEYDKVFTIV